MISSEYALRIPHQFYILLSKKVGNSIISSFTFVTQSRTENLTWYLISSITLVLNCSDLSPLPSGFTLQEKEKTKQSKQKTKASTNSSQTHPTNQMKALAGCKDDKIIAASKPTWPCYLSFAENSDLRVPHWNIPDSHVSLSSATINNMYSRAYSGLCFGRVFVAFLKFYKGMSISCDKHLFSYLILYIFKRKYKKIVCPCWRLVVTQKEHFFSPLHSYSHVQMPSILSV